MLFQKVQYFPEFSIPDNMKKVINTEYMNW